MSDKDFKVRNGLMVGNSVLIANTLGLFVNTFLTVNSTVVYTTAKLGVNTTAPSVSLHVAANDGIQIPLGNTTQRPSSSNGVFRYNTDDNAFEGYSNGAWGTIGAPSATYMKGNLGAIGDSSNANNIFRINTNELTANVTILVNENGGCVGPLTITGSLTINTGGAVVIS